MTLRSNTYVWLTMAAVWLLMVAGVVLILVGLFG